MIHRGIAGNVEEFFSVNERVRVVVIKLNKRYRLKIMHAYEPTAKDVGSFYEDIESPMNKGTAQCTIAMGAVNAKVGAKRVGEKPVGNFGIGTRNSLICREPQTNEHILSQTEE